MGLLELGGCGVAEARVKPMSVVPVDPAGGRELDVADRYAWVLTGRQVGRGPDHEPLVRSVSPVGRLTRALIDEAATEYRRRFAAGRDSREQMRR